MSSEDDSSYCTIHLVRHGQTDWNIKKRVQGQTDIPLNKKGEKQAEEMGKKLSHIAFDAVFSSDLIRAKRTAEIITLEKRLVVQTTKALRERYFGKFQGQSLINKEIINLIDRYKRLTDPSVKQEIESDDFLIKRFILFLREIAVGYLGKKVLVVSHGGPMRLFLIHLGFDSYENFTEAKIDNLAYIKILCDGVDFFIKETFGIKKMCVER